MKSHLIRANQLGTPRNIFISGFSTILLYFGKQTKLGVFITFTMYGGTYIANRTLGFAISHYTGMHEVSVYLSGKTIWKAKNEKEKKN